MTRDDWLTATPKCARSVGVSHVSDGHQCAQPMDWHYHAGRSKEDIRPCGEWICPRHSTLPISSEAAAARRAAASELTEVKTSTQR